MPSITDIGFKYKALILKKPTVANIALFEFTCFININSFRKHQFY